jgi:hypothetical protein
MVRVGAGKTAQTARDGVSVKADARFLGVGHSGHD